MYAAIGTNNLIVDSTLRESEGGEDMENSKKAYVAPQLTVYGSVEKITLKPGVGNANPNDAVNNPGRACSQGNASFCPSVTF